VVPFEKISALVGEISDRLISRLHDPSYDGKQMQFGSYKENILRAFNGWLAFYLGMFEEKYGSEATSALRFEQIRKLYQGVRHDDGLLSELIRASPAEAFDESQHLEIVSRYASWQRDWNKLLYFATYLERRDPREYVKYIVPLLKDVPMGSPARSIGPGGLFRFVQDHPEVENHPDVQYALKRTFERAVSDPVYRLDLSDAVGRITPLALRYLEKYEEKLFNLWPPLNEEERRRIIECVKAGFEASYPVGEKLQNFVKQELFARETEVKKAAIEAVINMGFRFDIRTLQQIIETGEVAKRAELINFLRFTLPYENYRDELQYLRRLAGD
jgi:hypothetical protein